MIENDDFNQIIKQREPEFWKNRRLFFFSWSLMPICDVSQQAGLRENSLNLTQFFKKHLSADLFQRPSEQRQSISMIAYCFLTQASLTVWYSGQWARSELLSSSLTSKILLSQSHCQIGYFSFDAAHSLCLVFGQFPDCQPSSCPASSGLH